VNKRIRAAVALFLASSIAPVFAVGINPVVSDTRSNTAIGTSALQGTLNNLIGGKSNTATSGGALYNATSGWSNTAVGDDSLYSVTTGSGNIGIGNSAGINITTGSYNITIGSYGASTDNRTIRVGSQGQQTATYVAGVYGTGTGCPDRQTRAAAQSGAVNWWKGRESNPRPRHYECRALTG
jgi:hypothetical protein